MSHLILPSKWTGPPSYATEIDENSPFSELLVDFTYTLGGTLYSPAQQAIATYSTFTRPSPTLAGWGKYYGTQSLAVIDTIPINRWWSIGDAMSAGGHTIFARNVVRNDLASTTATSWGTTRAAYGVCTRTDTSYGIAIGQDANSLIVAQTMPSHRTVLFPDSFVYGRPEDVFGWFSSSDGLLKASLNDQPDETTIGGTTTLSGSSWYYPKVQCGYNASTLYPGSQVLICGAFWIRRVLSRAERKEFRKNPYQVLKRKKNILFSFPSVVNAYPITDKVKGAWDSSGNLAANAPTSIITSQDSGFNPNDWEINRASPFAKGLYDYKAAKAPLAGTLVGDYAWTWDGREPRIKQNGNNTVILIGGRDTSLYAPVTSSGNGFTIASIAPHCNASAYQILTSGTYGPPGDKIFTLQQKAGYTRAYKYYSGVGTLTAEMNTSQRRISGCFSSASFYSNFDPYAKIILAVDGDSSSAESSVLTFGMPLVSAIYVASLGTDTREWPSYLGVSAALFWDRVLDEYEQRHMTADFRSILIRKKYAKHFFIRAYDPTLTLYQQVDEPANINTNDFIYTEESSSCQLQLGTVDNPTDRIDHALEFTAKSDNAGSLTATLLQSPSVIYALWKRDAICQATEKILQRHNLLGSVIWAAAPKNKLFGYSQSASIFTDTQFRTYVLRGHNVFSGLSASLYESYAGVTILYIGEVAPSIEAGTGDLAMIAGTGDRVFRLIYSSGSTRSFQAVCSEVGRTGSSFTSNITTHTELSCAACSYHYDEGLLRLSVDGRESLEETALVNPPQGPFSNQAFIYPNLVTSRYPLAGMAVFIDSALTKTQLTRLTGDIYDEINRRTIFNYERILATRTQNNIPSEWTRYLSNLTEAEANSITDYSKLSVRLDGTP